MQFEEYITVPRKRPYKSVLQFKVTLIGSNPPVWRRLVVPESYTFYDLHVAIQDAMGWSDYHLHNFEIKKGKRTEEVYHIECPWTDREYEEDNWPRTTEVPLTEFMRKKGDSAFYRYDYGDGWKLEVVLEGILPREKNKPYPICLGGRLSGPPEDCGGIHGYYRCIEAIANQDNTDGLLTWLGDWRPDDFDPNQIVFETPEKRFERATED